MNASLIVKNILLLLVVSFNAYAQDVNNVNSKIIAKLKIRQINTIEYQYKFGKIDTSGELRSMDLYNNKGKITASIYQHPERYDFDKNSTTRFLYDSVGNLTQLIKRNDDTKKPMIVCNYKENYITDKTIYDKEGIENGREVYKYNIAGKLYETIHYNKEGNVISKIVIIFNQLNKEIESLEYGSDGKLKIRSKVILDSKRKFVREEFDINNKKLSVNTVFKNQFGLDSLSIYTSYEYSFTNKTSFMYDKNMLLSGTIYFDKFGEPEYIEKFEYRYFED